MVTRFSKSHQPKIGKKSSNGRKLFQMLSNTFADSLLCVYSSAVPEALFAHSTVNVTHSLHHSVTTLVPLQAQ